MEEEVDLLSTELLSELEWSLNEHEQPGSAQGLQSRGNTSSLFPSGKPKSRVPFARQERRRRAKARQIKQLKTEFISGFRAHFHIEPKTWSYMKQHIEQHTERYMERARGRLNLELENKIKRLEILKSSHEGGGSDSILFPNDDESETSEGIHGPDDKAIDKLINTTIDKFIDKINDGAVDNVIDRLKYNNEIKNKAISNQHTRAPRVTQIYDRQTVKSEDRSSIQQVNVNFGGKGAMEESPLLDLHTSFDRKGLTSQEPNYPVSTISSPTSILESTDMSNSIGEVSVNDEFVHMDNIETQKSLDIVRLMLSVYDMFTTTNVTSRGSDSKPKSSSPPDQHNRPTKSPPPCRKRSHANGRKHEDDDQDESHDRAGKRRKEQSTAPMPDQQDARRLACPYFKHNPHKHQSSRACCGPGWTKVHRIKEHLYREHSIPIHCPRCRIIFGHANELSEHSRSAEVCQVKKAVPLEGFTKDQEKQLKSRREMFRAESEEDKWRVIYLILFPDTALGDLPSPYYDHTELNQHNVTVMDSPNPSGPIQYDAFLRRELPRRIREALESKIEEAMEPIEEILKNQLEGIVRDCHESLTRDYRTSRQPSANSSITGAKHENTASTQYPQSVLPPVMGESSTAQQRIPPSDEFTQLLLPPDTALDIWLNEMTLVPNNNQELPASDSGYLPTSENLWSPGDMSAWLSLNRSTPNELPIPSDVARSSHTAGEASGQYITQGCPGFEEDFLLLFCDDPAPRPPEPREEQYTGKGKERAREDV